MKSAKQMYEDGVLSQLSQEEKELLPLVDFDVNGNLLYHESEEDYLKRMEKNHK